MNQQPLLDLQPKRVEDTSRLALQSLQPLRETDLRWLLRLYRYLDETGHDDVTGKELALHYGVEATTTRPRLTGAYDRGWLLKGPIRASRAPREKRCRGYKPTLPYAAAQRALKALEGQR